MIEAKGTESLTASPRGTDEAPLHDQGHGSYRLYKQGCHCSECRAAQNAVIRSYRARKRELMRQDELHDAARIIQRGIWNGTDAPTIAAEVIAMVKG